MNTLTKSANDMNRLREELFFPVEQSFNRFFKDFFKGSSLDAVMSSSGYPKMDVYVENNLWKIAVAVSGVKPENIEVVMSPDHSVTISGQIDEELCNDNSATFYVKELRRSKFSRTIKLPDYVHGDPEAEIKNGLLTLTWTLRPVEEKPKPKLIEIKTSS